MRSCYFKQTSLIYSNLKPRTRLTERPGKSRRRLGYRSGRRRPYLEFIVIDHRRFEHLIESRILRGHCPGNRPPYKIHLYLHLLPVITATERKDSQRHKLPAPVRNRFRYLSHRVHYARETLPGNAITAENCLLTCAHYGQLRSGAIRYAKHDRYIAVYKGIRIHKPAKPFGLNRYFKMKSGSRGRHDPKLGFGGGEGSRSGKTQKCQEKKSDKKAGRVKTRLHSPAKCDNI